MDFQDRTIVITGGGTGIGLALAKQLVLRGGRVILFGPDENILSGACDELSRVNTHVDAKYFTGDVTRRDDLEALADFAWAQNGRADAIINNAGIGGPQQSVIDCDLDKARNLFEVNFWGMWMGMQVFGKRFIADGLPSAIYSVASENSLFNVFPFGGGAYVSSKHAIFGLMDMLRKELPDTIESGVIIPGWVATELARFQGMEPQEFAEIIIPQMENGEYYLVSHSYNMVRFDERYDELKSAFANYAPRHDGDDEYDVMTAYAKMRASKGK